MAGRGPRSGVGDMRSRGPIQRRRVLDRRRLSPVSGPGSGGLGIPGRPPQGLGMGLGRDGIAPSIPWGEAAPGPAADSGAEWGRLGPVAPLTAP